jgi:aspartate aminotransferase/aminotransferase
MGGSLRIRGLSYEGGIREISERAVRLEQEGRDIVHFEIGQPDSDSPEAAKNAAISALREGKVAYTPRAGLPELRVSLANMLKARGIDATFHDIVVTCGAVEALMTVFLAVLDPGDEVIVPTPAFPAYFDQVRLCSAVPVSVPSFGDPEIDVIESAITDRTRIIVINSPCNPTGHVLSSTFNAALLELAARRDLFVVSDECYSDFLYEGHFESPRSLPGSSDRVFVVGSLSKPLSMTGWRIGYVLGPSAFTPFVTKAHQMLTTCACSFAQAGAVTGLSILTETTTATISEYRERRRIVLDALSACEDLAVIPPSGAFYAFPDVSAIGLSATEFCTELLQEEGVALVPGDAFGAPGHVRIAYTTRKERVSEGMARFVRGWKRLAAARN